MYDYQERITIAVHIDFTSLLFAQVYEDKMEHLESTPAPVQTTVATLALPPPIKEDEEALVGKKVMALTKCGVLSIWKIEPSLLPKY